MTTWKSDPQPDGASAFKMRLRLIPFFILLIHLFSSSPSPAAAQGGFGISNPQVSYLFGRHVAFQAELTQSAPVSVVEIVFRQRGASETIVLPAELNESGRITGLYEMGENPLLKAFTSIDYWFRIHTSTQEFWESASFSFEYQDNRFGWVRLDEGPLQVHSYLPGSQLAQSVMDAARKGLEGFYQLLDAPIPGEMRIFVYTDPLELQAALNMGGISWVAGHADPANGLALVSIRPGREQQAEIERQIPHEVAHVMLYQLTGEGYYMLPNWLNEGLASNLELSPSPEMRRMLDQAAADGGLIPLAELCHAFPVDASQASLAYAQSESFVRFVYSRYGRLGMNALVGAYAAGEGCSRGMLAALGSSLEVLEREWRAVQFQEDPLRLALNEMGMWIALFAIGVTGPLSFIYIQRRRGKSR